jgi:putative ABC transport system permease protein
MIIHHVTGINSLNAFLPIPAAIILILISMFLTLVSGLIPSRSAAKKDPVVALRTE